MSEEKKIFPAHFGLYDPEDLSKKWFVYFYREGKRIRVYGDINKHATRSARTKAALKLAWILHEDGVGTMRNKIYDWLEGKRGIWRKKSCQTYKSKIDRLFDHTGPHLNKANVESFLYKIRKGKHPTTYNSYLQAFKQILKEVGGGPDLKDVNRVKTTKTPARYFLPSHVRIIKDHLLQHDPELWFFCQFIFYCFIRPGELRHLKVGDVLLEENKILIRSQVSKNRKNQYVAIPKAFRPDLEHLKDRSPVEYIFQRRKGLTNRDKPIGRDTMSQKHRFILRDLGFDPEYKLYSWKHTGAVMAVKAGIGVKALQMQLRHHSLDQVNEYLRQMGVWDMESLRDDFPQI